MRNGCVLARLDCFVTGYDSIFMCPAGAFADSVREFMPYREILAKEIKVRLKRMDEDVKRESALRDAKKLAEERVELQKRSWLDDIIENRK